MVPFPVRTLAVAALAVVAAIPAAGQLPDIRSVPADLQVPKCSGGTPAAGVRVKQVHPDWKDTDLYHTLYLPPNDHSGTPPPVIVELAGNGGFQNRFGDVCTGRPEDCKLGYGICAGRDCIWICLPFVSGDGRRIAETWWGDPPDFDVKPTVQYVKKTVPWVCDRYGGDSGRVILVGFSRGAIACNYVGLHDAEIADLWRGMVPYSHYDGVRKWPFSSADAESPVTRLQRLARRPQFICQESAGTAETRKWIEATGIAGDFTYVSTGFRNHNDAWILRPSPARDQLRQWFASLVAAQQAVSHSTSTAP
jgi:hypothetical protein